MKLLSLALFALVTAAMPLQAQEVVGQAAAAAEDELVKAKGSFKNVWVHPDADFSKYSNILPGDAEFEFRDVGPAKRYRSSTMSSGRTQEFGILEEDQAKFEEVVSEAFIAEMSKSKKFEIVDDVQPGTILLHGAVLDIVSHVPPELTGARNEVYLSSVASVTLVLELLDAETGQVLAYAEERRKIEKPGGRIDQFSMPANSVTVWAEVKRWARSSASRLRSGLEKAQKGKKK